MTKPPTSLLDAEASVMVAIDRAVEHMPLGRYARFLAWLGSEVSAREDGLSRSDDEEGETDDG